MTTGPNRPARINAAWLSFLASALALGVLVCLLVWDPSHWFQPRPEARPLIVYCAAGIKQPVEAAARAYEQQYGVPVELHYGGSGDLLAKIEVHPKGDLYLPGDHDYLAIARRKGLVDEIIPLGQMTPVVAVPRGNPRKLRSLDDVLARGVRLSQARPDAAAVGKLTRKVLTKAGRWSEFRQRAVVDKFTVNEVANDVVLGAADAGVVWDVTVRMVPGLDMVRLPVLEAATAHLALGVLHRTTQPTAALRFARFLSARDRGLTEFARCGFEVIEADRWDEAPELHLFAGAMLRPAIQETIKAFEEREGVKVKTIYNGCGILVGQMRGSKQGPDAYFACDQSFMIQVRDRFRDPITISTNQLVILVPKGNPHAIHSLEDLGKPGLRVGVGHEKQCAMGALTQKTLQQGGALSRVMHNVVVQSPTGDMLVNQMRTGALDAVIAYVSNGAMAADVLEAIPIDIPCALAVQPVALGRDSNHKQLTARLIGALRSETSRQRFEAFGFHWQAQAR